MKLSLYSAPDEKYLDHILICKEKFDFVFPIFKPTVIRTFESSIDAETLADSFLKMILFHDLGKLTKRWQEKVGSGTRLPSHATLGAAYLWKTLSDSIKGPICFAVAIHHTDRGLLGDNIERPDVQAITDGIIDYAGDIIRWDVKTEQLGKEFFPDEAKNLKVSALTEMARGLRVWARGIGLLEQHQRRIQTSLAHHILKLCDISAATERQEYQEEGEHDYYGGWLMVDNIKNYVDGLKKRTN
jgi:CRISPR-associated endonuclease Cas3-HD